MARCVDIMLLTEISSAECSWCLVSIQSLKVEHHLNFTGTYVVIEPVQQLMACTTVAVCSLEVVESGRQLTLWKGNITCIPCHSKEFCRVRWDNIQWTVPSVAYGTKRPFVCWCAIKKLLTDSFCCYCWRLGNLGCMLVSRRFISYPETWECDLGVFTCCCSCDFGRRS